MPKIFPKVARTCSTAWQEALRGRSEGLAGCSGHYESTVGTDDIGKMTPEYPYGGDLTREEQLKKEIPGIEAYLKTLKDEYRELTGKEYSDSTPTS